MPHRHRSRRRREVNVWSPATSGAAVLLLIPLSLLVCAALSTPLTRTAFCVIVEPPTAKLFVPAPASPEHSGLASRPPPYRAPIIEASTPAVGTIAAGAVLPR